MRSPLAQRNTTATHTSPIRPSSLHSAYKKGRPKLGELEDCSGRNWHDTHDSMCDMIAWRVKSPQEDYRKQMHRSCARHFSKQYHSKINVVPITDIVMHVKNYHCT